MLQKSETKTQANALNNEKKMPLKLKAPKGKFRVVGVDTFSNEDWIIGDFNKKEEACIMADAKGGTMLKIYVYDDRGLCKHSAGTY